LSIFILFFIPVYLIRSKRVNNLTWTKVSLRSFGFILLLCGLTVICTLSLNNTASYLAGGVLGGSLTLNLYPSLGKFGVLCLAIVFSAIGFIFCSGASFIRVLIRFYQWLTMQNSPEPEQTEEDEASEAVEEIVIREEDILATPLAENLSNAPIDDIVTPTNQINISGLSTTAQASNADKVQAFAADEKPDEFVAYDFEQQEPLPNVSISTQSSQVDLPSKDDFTSVWQQADDNNNSQSAVDFSQDFHASNFATDEAIPSVSLANPTQADADVESTAESDLARQFAAQEQQRLQEMEERAKAMGAQEVYQQIVQEQPQEPESKPHNYKPYGDSLVHPAFQQHKNKVEKPTTPLPSLDLLEHHPTRAQDITQEEIVETSQRIEQQLRNFNVKAKVKDVLVGPVVTRYELELDPGVKASRVTSLDTDLARALMFRSIRVAEVIPGKPYIGIETPNDHRQMVPLRDVLDSDEFRHSKALLSMALGKDISGKPVVVDLAKMPHLLVAGTTGSGKSVGVNTMILSLLYRVKPEEVKFIMIDPKVVELSIYNDIPHLLTEVVTDMKKAANALRWCVDEMERRYKLLSAIRVRNIEGFNEKIDEYDALNMPIPNPLWRPGDSMDNLPPPLEKLSYIVVIVDEFADLMMVAGKQVEELIARLAQQARAAGVPLVRRAEGERVYASRH